MAKTLFVFCSLARSHTTTALNVLVGVMRNTKATPPARIAAANAILDRGWGKATQPIENGDDGALELIHRIERVIVHSVFFVCLFFCFAVFVCPLQGRLWRPRFGEIAFLRRADRRDLSSRARHIGGVHSRSAAHAGAVFQAPYRRQD